MEYEVGQHDSLRGWGTCSMFILRLRDKPVRIALTQIQRMTGKRKQKPEKEKAVPKGADSEAPTLAKIRLPPKNITARDLANATNREASGSQQAQDTRQAPGIQLRFRNTIQVINEMMRDGVITRYAIGGAVGATFYLEPVRTIDVDIFVPIHKELGRSIILLDPFADYLKGKGYSMKGEYWDIEGSLVQFMPFEGDELLIDAMSQPKEFTIEGVRTFVFSAEHLAAIALKVGRPEKDVPRLQQFLREEKIDQKRFLQLVERFNLMHAWRAFQTKYLTNER